jgi:recombination protein RecA
LADETATRKPTAADDSLARRLAAITSWAEDVNRASKKNVTAPFVPDELELVATPAIPTGSPSLDALLGGGIPRGKFTEIYGFESSGKSTIAYQVIAELHRREPDALVVLLDAEGSFDPVRAKRMGIDLGDKKAKRQPRMRRLILRGEAEPGLEQLRQLASFPQDNGKPVIALVIIDSVAALVPKAEAEGEIGDQSMALLARLMSQSLRMLNIAVQTSGTTVLLINQTRTKIGQMYGDPTVVPGGKAIDFYCSIMMAVSAPKSEALKNKDGEPIASTVHARVKKNKINGAIGEAILQITPRDGVIFPFEVAKTGLKVGVVTKSGSFYSVSTLDGEVKAQGEIAFMRDIRKLTPEARNDLYDRIVKAGMERREAFFVDEGPEEAPSGEIGTADLADEAAETLLDSEELDAEANA